MNENEWVAHVIDLTRPLLQTYNKNLRVHQGQKLTYALEIRSYSEVNLTDFSAYETDILITEQLEDGSWKPRVVVEVKINRVTTHDAITYSEKSLKHKHIHPYLRYGIVLGNRKHYPLPGRLYRNGAYFDFMLSWVKFEPQNNELDDLVNILIEEVKASRKLEEILYSSRKRNREHYTVLHRPLILKEE